MLNSNSNSRSVINQNIKFNAVSGTMFKSCPQSFFLGFNLNSEYAERLFQKDPYIETTADYSTNYLKKSLKVVVLQTMLVGDMEVLAEIITVEEYEKLNSGGSE